MIEVKSLYKSFDGTVVLKGISSSFESSKVSLIIGQSGAGKTVFIKCLLGLIFPDSGEITYDNRSFLEMSRKQTQTLRKEIGMVFQSNALFDSMNIEENIAFPLKMLTKDPSDVIRDKVDEMLKRVGLLNANKKQPSEISGGMKRRVAVARAIILRPKYLFCDEPNSGLDPYMSSVIDGLIHDITKEYKIVTIINTHDMNSVLEIGEKVLLIKEGTIGWEGNKDEIYSSENKNINDFINRRAKK